MLWTWLVATAMADYVAVLDFEGALSADVLHLFGDQARGAALSQLDTEEYDIFTRENMLRLMREAKSTATGARGCIEGACHIETAENIGADLVVSGTVVELDGTWVASMKLHDVSSAKLLAMEKIAAQTQVALLGEIEQGTRRLLESLVWSDAVWVSFSSKPRTQLLVNGRELCAQTPCRRQVVPGLHRLSWSRQGYGTIIEDIKLEDGAELFRKLNPEVSTVVITEIPDGVLLALDGTTWKRSPINDTVSAGAHTIQVIDPCYQEQSLSFDAIVGSTVLNLPVTPLTTSVRFKALAPDGRSTDARVLADGEWVGQSGSWLQLPSCTTRLELHSEDARWDGIVELNADKRNRHTVQLEPKRETVGLELRTIGLGSFLMGSPPDEQGRSRDELQHPVEISRPFAIGVSEVSQRLWEEVMGNNPAHHQRCGQRCPVEQVSWCDALIFTNRLSGQEGLEPVYQLPMGFVAELDAQACNRLSPLVSLDLTADGYRLPTEAEWEFAARDQGQLVSERYAGSNQPDGAWYLSNARNRAHPSCERPPNRLGLCDMSGNVFEWTWDSYLADNTELSRRDPIAITSSATRVARGGSYQSNSMVLRVAFRHHTDPGQRSKQIGLRLARWLDVSGAD